jgi:hypothetical protein
MLAAAGAVSNGDGMVGLANKGGRRQAEVAGFSCNFNGEGAKLVVKSGEWQARRYRPARPRKPAN